MSDAFTINVTKFNGMCRELSGLTATRFERVVLFEAGRVIENASKNTVAASVVKIKSYYEARKFTTQPADLYTPGASWDGRGQGKYLFGTTRRVVNGSVIYYLGNRYPNDLWELLVGDRVSRVTKAIKARGLSKGSWYRLAKTFGVPINVPAYAKNAIAHTGRTYDDVSSSRRGSGGAFSLHVINAQPTVQTPGAKGRGALQSAISGRVKYFERNVSKKVFESAAAIAKRYPGMKAS